MPAIKLLQPNEVLSPAVGVAPALSQYKYRFLAQGDSWFSIGTFKLHKNSSLLHQLNFSETSCAINCASPGAKLTHMVDNLCDPNFVNLLCGTQRVPWHGILLSAGGNDMIDALGQKASTTPQNACF